MAEIKYNLSNVAQIAINELVDYWVVRGEREGGWALVWVDFPQDAEHLAHELAKRLCQQLQFDTYTVWCFTEKPDEFLVKTVDIHTSEVIEENTIICE